MEMQKMDESEEIAIKEGLYSFSDAAVRQRTLSPMLYTMYMCLTVVWGGIGHFKALKRQNSGNLSKGFPMEDSSETHP
jgi:hypothetical protein